MTYLLIAGVGFGLGYLVAKYQAPSIKYPIVPKWSHFKAGDRIFDGDRWTGEDDAA